MSKKETVSSAFLRGLQYQEYEVRSAAEAMPEEEYSYRPAEGKFKTEKPEFGPSEVRTFAQQGETRRLCQFCVCRRAGWQNTSSRLRQGWPQPRQHEEGITRLPAGLVRRGAQVTGRDRCKKHVRPHRGSLRRANTRLGLAAVIVWHNANHYGQMVFYLRENGIVPPGSRPHPPELQEKY